MATRTHRIITLLIIASTATAGMAYGGVSLSAPPPTKSARVSRIPAADSGLNGFLAGEFTLRDLENLGYRTRNGLIQVVVEVEPGFRQAVADELVALGARNISKVRNFVQAELPFDALATAAATPNVRWIRKPLYAARPKPDSSPATKGLKLDQTTEALATMNAAAWHAAGHTGGGVKVGIIDLEFGGFELLLGSALPPASRVHHRGFGWTVLDPAKTHGTACAEIIHDIAPNAELYFAQIETATDLLDAIDWLASNGVDVVSKSMAWFGVGPGDGTGPIHDAISQNVQSNDAVWAVAAGNHRQEHWQSSTTDSDADGWIDFAGPDSEINYFKDSGGNLAWFEPGDTIDPVLWWNDWNRPNNDYDLFLFRRTGQGDEVERMAGSENDQSGNSNQYPVESLSYEIDVAGEYGIAVFMPNVSGSNDLEIIARNSRGAALSQVVEKGSITQPADSPDVISVAAGYFTSPYETHYYSGMGPNNGPGGGFTGGSVEPDIMAYAGVSTASKGPGAFYGTSAATPHVAGAAALVRSAKPTWTRTDVRTYLLSNAADLGLAGKDNTYGRGRLVLGAPPATSGGGGGGGGTTDCGNAYYDNGQTAGATWFEGGQAGNPDAMYAVYFDLSDFGYQPGAVEITAFCAGNSNNYGGPWPNEVFIYPDANGKPNTSVTLGHGTIRTGDGSGPSVVTLASPVTLNSDFWLVNRGYAPHAGEDFNMEYDDQSNTGHSFVSLTGANNLELTTGRNYILRATLRAKTGGGGGGGGGNYAYTYHVAAIAHAAGVGDSLWKSKLGILNRSGSTADVNLTYNYGGGSSVQWAAISNGELRTWDDAALSLFGLYGNSAGSVVIESTKPLVITARTYTESRDGSFGSFLPGVDAGLSYGETGVLSQLTGNNDFRTNAGFVNLVGKSCRVEVQLYSSNGSKSGSAKTVTVAANGYTQINNVFKSTGSPNRNNAYATVKVRTSGCEVWGYASVIDGTTSYPGTNDATSIPISILP